MNQKEYRSHGTLLFFTVIVLLLTGEIRAEDVPSRFFQGLLERELYRVAEDYAQRQLHLPELEPAVRADLTIHLSQALCQHARLTSDSSAEAIWDEAERVVTDLINSSPAEPALTLLQLQLARIPAAHTSALRFEMEVQGENPVLRERGLALQQLTLDRLGTLQAHLTHLETLQREEPASSRRASIGEEANFLIAESYVDKGRLLPAGVDRAGAWKMASELLEDLIRKSHDDVYKWRSRLLRTYVARMQQDESTAETLLKSMLGEAVDIPGGLRDQAVAELARLRIDQGRVDEALSLLSDRINQPPLAPPEVRAMIVESLLTLWQNAGKKGRVDLQAGVLEKAEEQLALTGGEWHRWAASRLARLREERDFGPELAALLSQGKNAYQSGRIPEAIQSFGKAAQVAESRRLADKAVELLLTQGALQLQNNQPEEAATTFGLVSERFPTHSRVEEADLLKCYALGKAVESGADAESVSACQVALESHMRLYAGRDSGAEAAWMLGLLRERLQKLPEAWQAYGSVPLKHSRSDEAVLRMTVIVDRLMAGNPPLDPAQALTAVQELEQRLVTRVPESQRLNLLQSEASLKLAMILQKIRGADENLQTRATHLIDRVQSSVDAEIRDAETASQTVDPQWVQLQSQVTQARIISLASQKHLDEAKVLITRLQQANPELTLQVLHGLSTLAVDLEEQERPLMGELQLQAATALNLKRDQLNRSQQEMLDECLLEASLAVGRTGDALALYESRPTGSASAEILTRISDQILAEGDVGKMKSVRELWVKQESREKKGSPPWLVARLMIARLLAREGATNDCRKLIGITRIIYPELGGAETARRFQEVLDSLPSP